MDKFAERLLIAEVSLQCQYALMSYGELQNTLDLSVDEIIQQGIQPKDVSMSTWFYIQSFLVASGNVSKFFWPDARSQRESPYPDRGGHLKTLIGVDDTSVLKDRELRNIFEHYDSRIEDWVFSVGGGQYIDRQVGHFDVPDPSQVMRLLDPDNMILLFRGKPYELVLVHNEIRRILTQIRARFFWS